MLEDKILLHRFKRGSRAALQRIYEKHCRNLLTLATALLGDVNTAEDVVHDVFVTFAQSASNIRREGSLKAYLTTCVANRARDRLRQRKRHAVTGLDSADAVGCQEKTPAASAICNEELLLLNAALAQLPYEQREAVILRARGQMAFRTIAQLQNVSTKTAQSRYRYGLDRLRVLLNGRVRP